MPAFSKTEAGEGCSNCPLHCPHDARGMRGAESIEEFWTMNTPSRPSIIRHSQACIQRGKDIRERLLAQRTSPLYHINEATKATVDEAKDAYLWYKQLLTNPPAVTPCFLLPSGQFDESCSIEDADRHQRKQYLVTESEKENAAFVSRIYDNLSKMERGDQPDRQPYFRAEVDVWNHFIQEWEPVTILADGGSPGSILTEPRAIKWGFNRDGAILGPGGSGEQELILYCMHNDPLKSLGRLPMLVAIPRPGRLFQLIPFSGLVVPSPALKLGMPSLIMGQDVLYNIGQLH